jgi:hypothetical protein
MIEDWANRRNQVEVLLPYEDAKGIALINRYSLTRLEGLSYHLRG